MNQINLDKLFQRHLGSNTTQTEPKLIIAKAYEAQASQAKNGQFALNVSTPSGAVHIKLPKELPSNLQKLLQDSANSSNHKNSATTKLMAKLIPIENNTVKQHDGETKKVQLTLSGETVNNKQTLTHHQLQLVLSASLKNSDIQKNEIKDLSTNIVLNLQKDNAQTHIKLPDGRNISLSTQLQTLLNQLSSQAPNAASIALEFDRNNQLTAKLASSQNGPLTNTISLTKSEQEGIIKQLQTWFNQQYKSTAQLPSAILQLINEASAKQNLSGNNSVRLIQQDGTWQLQHQASTKSQSITLDEQAFNKAIHFIKDKETQSAQAPLVKTALTQNQQTIAQAWRQLLPLLPIKPDAFASLKTLPEPVQQILQLIRQSQLKLNTLTNTQQVQTQLASLLQFQPLQNAPKQNTNAGVLAVAIQLLLSQLIPKTQPSPLQQSSRNLSRLISQLEPAQASSLLRQLASHSSTFQQSQLATLENTGNNQQLLLQLPLNNSEQTIFSQLLIEQKEAEQKENEKKQTLWQLTMKFDLQHMGQLMVVAKLKPDELQLQFYTEQQQAKIQADTFLPILKERCQAQGIALTQASCVLGKIPKTLLPRANSLLAIKV